MEKNEIIIYCIVAVLVLFSSIIIYMVGVHVSYQNAVNYANQILIEKCSSYYGTMKEKYMIPVNVTLPAGYMMPGASWIDLLNETNS